MRVSTDVNPGEENSPAGTQTCNLFDHESVALAPNYTRFPGPARKMFPISGRNWPQVDLGPAMM